MMTTNISEEEQQDQTVEDDIEEPLDDVPEVSYNSYDELDDDEEKIYPYDEEKSQHQIKENSSREGVQSMLDQVLVDAMHSNNEILDIPRYHPLGVSQLLITPLGVILQDH